MTEGPEVVAYLFDYEKEHHDGATLVPGEMEISKDDPRTHDRWSHVEVTEIHELVKKEEYRDEHLP